MASAPKTVTWLEWLVYTNDVKQLWQDHHTYLLSQAVFMFAGLITFLHAFNKGGRWPYLWFGTMLHGISSDNFWHFVMPELDNFWQSQTPVMLLGGRLPLHIIFLYPAFIYHAIYAVSKLNLPRYAEPFAIGLLTVFIDLPYDIVSVKFVHWTWHDTDPNIFDRHYWVPWASYYFHAAFAASFYFFFTATRSWLAPKVGKWDAASTLTEWKAMLVASLLGMPGGVFLFVLMYHPLHDVYGIHTEVVVFLFFSFFAIFVLHGLISERQKTKEKLTAIDYLMLVQLAMHYLLYLVLVIFSEPEKEVVKGLREPVGPCNEAATLMTPLGMTLKKRKWFCPTDYDEGYFDFHCVGGKLPPNGSYSYTICGTPFENRAEYIAIISTINIFAFGLFYGLYFKTQASSAPAKKLKTK